MKKKKISKQDKIHIRTKNQNNNTFGNSQTVSTDTVLESYSFQSERIPVNITVVKRVGEFVPTYVLRVSVISKTTEMILERVREELIRRVSLGAEDIADTKKTDLVEDKFNELIGILINKYFPDSDDDTVTFLKSYLRLNSLGLGQLELVMNDENLEELVVNQASDPVWVYHKKHGWLRTNVYLKNEDQTRHYASIIGRKVGRQITVLSPLLDAHLGTGDRVNATLSPVSTNGNTITIRKFSKDPWTITKFLKTRTISPEAAAIIWTAIQFELSALIAGGTASGKTSALNVFANFFPPNQRIISIEDTREIVLPKFLHWVPLNTTLPNAEGKGEISMGDLLINSLRMRPDRILVGEVRRKRETETLFEAIHTGHSVYATFHANSAKETVERLTNAPLDVPKIMLPAISLIIVQFRNRRSGKRRTFQVAEIMPNGESNVILQYDIKKDVLVKIGKSKALFDNISLFTGMTDSEITKELNDKIKVLDYLVAKDINDVDGVGRIVAEYYTNKENLMHYVNTKTDFPLASQLKIDLVENPQLAKLAPENILTKTSNKESTPDMINSENSESPQTDIDSDNKSAAEFDKDVKNINSKSDNAANGSTDDESSGIINNTVDKKSIDSNDIVSKKNSKDSTHKIKHSSSTKSEDVKEDTKKDVKDDEIKDVKESIKDKHSDSDKKSKGIFSKILTTISTKFKKPEHDSKKDTKKIVSDVKEDKHKEDKHKEDKHKEDKIKEDGIKDVKKDDKHPAATNHITYTTHQAKLIKNVIGFGKNNNTKNKIINKTSDKDINKSDSKIKNSPIVKYHPIILSNKNSKHKKK